MSVGVSCNCIDIVVYTDYITMAGVHHQVLEFIKVHIFLRHEDAMVENWQKLIFHWKIYLFLR